MLIEKEEKKTAPPASASEKRDKLEKKWFTLGTVIIYSWVVPVWLSVCCGAQNENFKKYPAHAVQYNENEYKIKIF